VTVEWVAADGRTITMASRAKEPAPATALTAASFLSPRPEPATIERMVSELVYEPDERGISTKSYGWFCGMNHGDHPGRVYAFATADRRLVRIVYPAYCDRGGGAVPQTARVEIFERKKTP
jgi:hypothetical protein